MQPCLPPSPWVGQKYEGHRTEVMLEGAPAFPLCRLPQCVAYTTSVVCRSPPVTGH